MSNDNLTTTTGPSEPFDTDDGAGPTSAPQSIDEAPVVISRRRRPQFIPPQPERPESGSPVQVSRNWGLGLRSAKARESGLTRNREIAGDLPAWAPLPPGELSVRRHRDQP